MPDKQTKKPTGPAAVQGGATPQCPTETSPNTCPLDKQSDCGKLTAEEQMALFEKELKENDWGHQPC